MISVWSKFLTGLTFKKEIQQLLYLFALQDLLTEETKIVITKQNDSFG